MSARGARGAWHNGESYRKKEYGHARAARERAGWDCVFIGRRRVQCVCCDGAGTHRGHAREWAGREGVNRIFLYELRHTRIPKYSTHNNRKAHATVCRGAIARISSGRTPPLSTLHAHAITTHNSRSPLLPLSHSALADRLLSYPRLPASLNQRPLFQSPLAHKHSSHSFCVHHFSQTRARGRPDAGRRFAPLTAAGLRVSAWLCVRSESGAR